MLHIMFEYQNAKSSPDGLTCRACINMNALVEGISMIFNARNATAEKDT